MIYLLDTNVCIHLLNEKQSRVTQNFRQHNPADIVLCSVVKAELLYGARRSQRMESNLQLLKAFFAPLQSLPFDDECAEHFGQIHADLLNQGKPIGPNDTLIAAIRPRPQCHPGNSQHRRVQPRGALAHGRLGSGLSKEEG